MEAEQALGYLSCVLLKATVRKWTQTAPVTTGVVAPRIKACYDAQNDAMLTDEACPESAQQKFMHGLAKET